MPNKTSKSKSPKKVVAKKTTNSLEIKNNPSIVNSGASSDSSKGCKISGCLTKIRCCTKTKIVVALVIALIAVAAFIFYKKSDKHLDSGASVSTVGDVEKVVAQWVENNPQLILESVVNMQKKEAEKQAADAGKNVSKRMKDLYERADDPSITPSKYDVSIIEFFDYNCGYCKRSLPVIEQLVKDDTKVRVIFKELPILGQSSEDLARVALAFNMIAPDKYFSFHQALMKSNAKTTNDAIQIAGKLGVSADQLKKVLEKSKAKIDEKIQFDRELASSIGINGTPGFLIGEELIPGATDLNSLKEKIKNLRKK